MSKTSEKKSNRVKLRIEDVERLSNKSALAAAGRYKITPASANAAVDANNRYWGKERQIRKAGGRHVKVLKPLQDFFDLRVKELARKKLSPTLKRVLGVLGNKDSENFGNHCANIMLYLDEKTLFCQLEGEKRNARQVGSLGPYLRRAKEKLESN